jgi:hypothetical protein
MSARWLAKVEARRQQGQALVELQDKDLIMRMQRRLGAEGNRAQVLARADEVRVQRERGSERATAMIGGTGGHEGGAPDSAVKRASVREIPAGRGIPTMAVLDEGRFVADSGQVAPVRRRPADREFAPVGIRGEVVRTTGMSREVTDKPVASPRGNAAGHQPVRDLSHTTRGGMFVTGTAGGGHATGTSQGRYVPRSQAVDNSAPTPSPARAPHRFSGKHSQARPTGQNTFKEGGMVKAKRVGKPSAWISHVKAYQTQHGCSYREAMVNAKATYQK